MVIVEVYNIRIIGGGQIQHFKGMLRKTKNSLCKHFKIGAEALEPLVAPLQDGEVDVQGDSVFDITICLTLGSWFGIMCTYGSWAIPLFCIIWI